MEHHIPIFGMGGSKLFEHLEVGSSDVGAWVWTKNLVLLDMSVHCTPRVRNTKVYSKTITTLGIIKQQHHTLKQFGPSDQLVLIFYQKIVTRVTLFLFLLIHNCLLLSILFFVFLFSLFFIYFSTFLTFLLSQKTFLLSQKTFLLSQKLLKTY